MCPLALCQGSQAGPIPGANSISCPRILNERYMPRFENSNFYLIGHLIVHVGAWTGITWWRQWIVLHRLLTFLAAFRCCTPTALCKLLFDFNVVVRRLFRWENRWQQCCACVWCQRCCWDSMCASMHFKLLGLDKKTCHFKLWLAHTLFFACSR